MGHPDGFYAGELLFLLVGCHLKSVENGGRRSLAGVLLLNGGVWPERISRIPRGFKCRFLNAARRRVQLGVQLVALWADVPLQMADAVRGRFRPDPLDGPRHFVSRSEMPCVPDE